MAAAKKRCFSAISVFYWIFTSDIQSPRFTNDYEFGISVSKIRIFFKIGTAKKSIGWAKYVYVCEWEMCWRNFCNLSLVTKKCEK